MLIIASVLFVILTGLAMIAYPGGSLYDRAGVHYNFSENFFSDLGTTVTYSGRPNTASDILFISALGIIGIALIYFSKIWRGVSIDSHEMVIPGIMSKIFLIISGASFIGVAFTPWNLYFDNHVLFVKLAFGSLLGWSIMMIILEARNPKLRNLLVLNIIYVLMLGYYVWLLFYGPKFGTLDGLEFQAIAQKIIVYASVINLAIQAWGILSFLKRTDFRKTGRQNFYV
ncbi:MAG: hypothetical protein ABIY50_08980 [Ignavibacteria bacterium]